ncbi:MULTISPECIES: hypothetical protein [Paenibacillus]|jgi:hypothetical protein|uniref:hypothetical protein n=1 Tax=Paenibacillus TaxID=44249 RepID=UPI000B0199EE|nr:MULTISPECIES: hypothetical protein [Paenibacillus]
MKIMSLTTKKAKNRNREFEIILHGGKVENKKPKKVKSLSDLGFFANSAIMK